MKEYDREYLALFTDEKLSWITFQCWRSIKKQMHFEMFRELSTFACIDKVK
jgi:hypothetical protein